ncbi:MAG: hypothetical protein Q9219_005450 [cf. Caloplaca sp. 3 TL-2023]
MSPTTFTSDSATLEPATVRIPLEDSTIHHLRQAIRAQAVGSARSLQPRGLGALFRKRVDSTTFRDAASKIKAHVDHVLDLELEEANAHRRAYSAPAESSAVGKQPGRPTQNNASRSKNVEWHESDWEHVTEDDGMNDGFTASNASASGLDIDQYVTSAGHGRSNERIRSVTSDEGGDEDDRPSAENVTPMASIDDQVVDKMPTRFQTPEADHEQMSQPLPATQLETPPPSALKPPETPAPKKMNIFSRLTPSRLFGIFATPPSPTPVKAPLPAEQALLQDEPASAPLPSPSSSPIAPDVPGPSSIDEDESYTPRPSTASLLARQLQVTIPSPVQQPSSSQLSSRSLAQSSRWVPSPSSSAVAADIQEPLNIDEDASNTHRPSTASLLARQLQVTIPSPVQQQSSSRLSSPSRPPCANDPPKPSHSGQYGALQDSSGTETQYGSGEEYDSDELGECGAEKERECQLGEFGEFDGEWEGGGGEEG